MKHCSGLTTVLTVDQGQREWALSQRDCEKQTIRCSKRPNRTRIGVHHHEGLLENRDTPSGAMCWQADASLATNSKHANGLLLRTAPSRYIEYLLVALS